jgi:cytochrome c oxidase subunit IV
MSVPVLAVLVFILLMTYEADYTFFTRGLFFSLE